jgi:hypothetical protein
MPRGKQFGYIFKKNLSNQEINQVIAHELGHGRWRLRHTFDDKYGAIFKENEPADNLMSYGGGTHIAKWQWDEINDPAWVNNPFESDEAGMDMKSSIDNVIEKATQLTREFGAVYAVVHGFSPKKPSEMTKQYDKSFIPDDLNGKIPLYMKGFYSEKRKEYTTVLFFQYTPNESVLKTETANYDLLKELNTTLNISNKMPYLAVLMPRDEDRDCTPFIGDLNEIAAGAIKTGEYTNYYEKMLQAVASCTQEASLLIFASGYRLKIEADMIIESEYPNTNNNIQPVDIYDYWVGMDKKFIDRLSPRTSVYVDGHYSLTTSNHLTIPNFLASMAAITAISTSPAQFIPTTNDRLLNTTPNVNGFNERRRGGIIAGARILEKIKNGEYSMRIDNEGKIIDKVDIVCHSMGFAYALGIVDILKQAGVPLGRFYIFAPENACSGEVNINEWEEVWQYGSDEANDPVWVQDGVAPQCKISGLLDMINKSGRAYVPSTAKRGFVNSHKIENYEWIFTTIKDGDKGYVKPRK